MARGAEQRRRSKAPITGRIAEVALTGVSFTWDAQNQLDTCSSVADLTTLGFQNV
jgi:hypothetical protein